MPRYHFHVHDGVDIKDPDGTDLPDINAARSKALVLAGSMIADAGSRNDLGEEWSVEVMDHAGMILFRMDFIVAASAATARVSRSS